MADATDEVVEVKADGPAVEAVVAGEGEYLFAISRSPKPSSDAAFPVPVFCRILERDIATYNVEMSSKMTIIAVPAKITADHFFTGASHSGFLSGGGAALDFETAEGR
jgi:hypothetical protein